MTKEEIKIVADWLISIHRGGFGEPGSYRLPRTTFREILSTARVEGGTLQTLHNYLREAGYLLTPVDIDDYSKAQVWILQSLDLLMSRPVADEEWLNAQAEAWAAQLPDL